MKETVNNNYMYNEYQAGALNQLMISHLGFRDDTLILNEKS